MTGGKLNSEQLKRGNERFVAPNVAGKRPGLPQAREVKKGEKGSLPQSRLPTSHHKRPEQHQAMRGELTWEEAGKKGSPSVRERVIGFNESFKNVGRRGTGKQGLGGSGGTGSHFNKKKNERESRA